MKKLFNIILFSLVTFISYGQDIPTADLSRWKIGYEISGTDTLLIDSLTGVGDPQLVLTYCSDQLTNINNGYIDCRSLCRLNGQLVNNIFSDSNYVSKSFFLFEDEVIDSEGYLTYPYRLTEISRFTTSQTSTDSVRLYTYFNVPKFSTTAIRVAKSGGDATTIAGGIALAGVGDTVYIETGEYDETNYLYWRFQNIICIGNVKLTSTGTSYVILVGADIDLILQGLEIDGGGNTSTGILFSGIVGERTINKCSISNVTTNIIKYNSTTDSYLYMNAILFNSDKTMNTYFNFKITNSFINNTAITSFANSDSIIFNYNRIKYTNANGHILALDTYPANKLTVNANSFEEIIANTVIRIYPTINIDLFNFNNNICSVDSLQIAFLRVKSNFININKNKFTNNCFATISNIFVESFDSCYIRNNEFKIETGNMFAINVYSEIEATELYIENNIDTSYASAGYFIRCGTELTTIYDNNINNIYIKYNVGYGLNYLLSETTTAHGILLGFTSNNIYCTGNYLIGFGLNYVIKGSTGTNSENLYFWANQSSKAVSYGYYSKGVDSVRFYNNVSYDDPVSYFFTENTGGDPASYCEVINSINQTRSSGYVYYFDNASSNNFISSNNILYSNNSAYYNSITYNYTSWQGLGYDANSYNTNPNFYNASAGQFWPVASDAIGNGKILGNDYRLGLDITSTCPDNIVTKYQLPLWSIGTYVVQFPIIFKYGKSILTNNKAILSNQ